ncbi:NADPH-dependent FMN reductase [Noviherbaspirillum pedocola]|uniref:NAD(P)H-dependent oxidoreductase n=1 Tax=Noviherbaspirillum pedocola TaxID=2801341 RepID=A0A934SV55_9BURK|nr:NAD(P)H-dependent oxidoreductase [Noviherbaspirillum pedocola]MBK4737386.1 NAD(P)H-dependent oxidoreductase [Noviherbaspirillum pedocola]
MPAESFPLIVGIGGTTRAGSSSEKALMVSLRAAQAEGAQVIAVAGPALDLPMYAPEKKDRSSEAARLVDLFRRCDGLIIASPSYHGSISGLVKNALDYTEDLSSDERVYFDGCAVGLISCAAGWQGAGQTLSALRAIAHSLRGWPTPLGAMLNTSTKVFDDAGACLDLSAKFQLETVGRQVVQFARLHNADRIGTS